MQEDIAQSLICTVVGTVKYNPQLKETKDGNTWLKLSIIVIDELKSVDVDVKIFDEARAKEACEKYVKGDIVEVVGVPSADAFRNKHRAIIGRLCIKPFSITKVGHQQLRDESNIEID